MTITIISIILLFTPLLWEILDDASGEKKSKKTQDVFIRLLIAVFAACIGYALTGVRVNDGVILSLAIHFFFFDYIIHYILIKRGTIETKENWFTYLGETAEFNKWKPWIKLGAKGRLYVRAGVLVVAVLIYIL